MSQGEYQLIVKQSAAKRPHRLVVRTSRCGRDNPGLTPGVVIFLHGTSFQAAEKPPTGSIEFCVALCQCKPA